MRQTRVRQPGAVEDATDHLPPFREGGEGRRAWRTALPNPLVDQGGHCRKKLRTVLPDPAFDVGVAVAVAVDFLGCEAEADSSAATFDVRLPGGVVRRERKLRLVGKREGFDVSLTTPAIPLCTRCSSTPLNWGSKKSGTKKAYFYARKMGDFNCRRGDF